MTDCQMDIMVDLETMGIMDGAPVLTIGAVLFNPYNQDSAGFLLERAFLRKIDVSDAIDNSMGVEGATLRWWLEQEDAAIKALVGKDCVSSKVAMTDFTSYCSNREPWTSEKFFAGHNELPETSTIWAKGPDFDCKKLEYVYAKHNLQMPFKFYQYACVRTIQRLAWETPGDVPKFNVGAKHDARVDAVAQAMVVQAAYVELGLSHASAELSTWESHKPKTRSY